MDLTNEQVVEHLGSLTVMQLCELTRELETQWGVTATPVTVPQLAACLVCGSTGVHACPGPKAAEQTEFSVVLQSVEPAQKIAGIKVIRDVAGLTLSEAKTFIEGLPKTFKEGLSKAEAEEIQGKFVAAGVKVTLQ